jgi:hypothetical protein
MRNQEDEGSIAQRKDPFHAFLVSPTYIAPAVDAPDSTRHGGSLRRRLCAIVFGAEIGIIRYDPEK